ncbi:MAG: terminase large subunit [Phycisphaerales bacterium]|nr:MAG: terminase large subunit [Phycisphaerales bacterium]
MSSKRSSSARGRPRRRPAEARTPPIAEAYFDKEQANRACQFFELFLTHTKGEWAGQPFIPHDWQRDQIIRPLFGWRRKSDGLRWYRRCDLWVPRKNGKSTLAAGVALYLLFGDEEAGAELYLLANDKEQASIVFREAARMVRACPDLNDRSQVFDSARTKSIVYPEQMSSLQALSSLPQNKDGLNPSGVVFDEIHELRDFELWDKMTTGSATRRQPLTFVISTAGYDRHTVGWREYVQDKRILEGKSRIEDRLVVIYEAGPKDDWKQESTWKKANPGYGVTIKPREFRSLFNEALEDASKEAAFKRYFLNIWTGQKTGWLDVEDWDKCAGQVDPAVMASLQAWLGLDLSKRSDLTALVSLFRQSEGGAKRFYVLPHFFVPEDNIDLKEKRDGVPYREWAKAGHVTLTPGNVVDYAAIREKILEDWARRFQIREVAYDPYNATQIANELTAAGMTCAEIIQTIKHVSPATMELKNLVLEGKISHGGNPVLRWMVENVAVISDVNGNERLTKKGSTSRIDGLAALVTALVRASVADVAPSVYEKRGVIQL